MIIELVNKNEIKPRRGVIHFIIDFSLSRSPKRYSAWNEKIGLGESELFLTLGLCYQLAPDWCYHRPPHTHMLTIFLYIAKSEARFRVEGTFQFVLLALLLKHDVAHFVLYGLQAV